MRPTEPFRTFAALVQNLVAFDFGSTNFGGGLCS